MTTEEINEIQTAVEHIKHVCIDDPLPGKYYDLCRAVLPVLEYAVNPVKIDEGMGAKLLIGRMALTIARRINQKQRMTILQDKGKKDVKAGTKTAAEYTAKMPKYKVKLSPETVKKLKQEGRIIEKGKGK